MQPKQEDPNPVAKEAEDARSHRKWRSLPDQGIWILVSLALASLLIHLLTGYELTRLGEFRNPFDFSQKKPPVKIKIVERPKKDTKRESTPDTKKILETKQQETERPDHADHVGNVNHKTDKETRVSDKKPRDKGADPGNKGKPKATPKQAEAPRQPPAPKAPVKPLITKSPSGKLSFDSLKPKPRNAYEALLPNSVADLPGEIDSGYQDYLDDRIDEGDRIDINTTEYRYIGYFTNLRKAIELVWNYPTEASRRGMQGEVNLEFSIDKDGTASRIKVLKSSGYEILDQAIVDAIRLASPFSPLPDGFGKERIVVTGSFRYVLHGYGSH